MRQILDQQEKEKKRKRNQIIIGIILAGLMVLSSVGFAFLNTNFGGNNSKTNPGKENYNSYEFTAENNGLWSTDITGMKFYFRYTPKETEDINVPNVDLGKYAGKILYINSQDSRAIQEISSVLQLYSSRVQYACIEGMECKNNELPLKTCDDNIISIEESNSTEITITNNCVFIKGKGSDKLKASDAFLYKLLGIRQF